MCVVLLSHNVFNEIYDIIIYIILLKYSFFPSISYDWLHAEEPGEGLSSYVNI